MENLEKFKQIFDELHNIGIYIVDIGSRRKVYTSTGNGTIFSSGNDVKVPGSITHYVTFKKDGKGDTIFEKTFVCGDIIDLLDAVNIILNELKNEGI